jgi:hypothetical protein
MAKLLTIYCFLFHDFLFKPNRFLKSFFSLPISIFAVMLNLFHNFRDENLKAKDVFEFNISFIIFKILFFTFVGGQGVVIFFNFIGKRKCTNSVFKEKNARRAVLSAVI